MRVDAPKDSALPVEEIIARDPASALYLPYVERLVEDGRLEEAIALCEERRRRPGRGVGDHIVLGRAYLADGQLGPARAEFQSVLDLDRENVVALKALGGILAHEGNHNEAASYYQAVCRVDPGDLESQTALHQITSGEFPEIRPADVIVGQGGLTWQPVKLPREEEHLSELALGLRTIERFDASSAESASSSALAAYAPRDPIDLPVETIAPPPAHEPVRPYSPNPFASEARESNASDAREPFASDAREWSVPDTRLVNGEVDRATPAPPASAPGAAAPPTALGDVVEQSPPTEMPLSAPGTVVEGNKNAFETWLRQLSGRE